MSTVESQISVDEDPLPDTPNLEVPSHKFSSFEEKMSYDRDLDIQFRGKTVQISAIVTHFEVVKEESRFIVKYHDKCVYEIDNVQVTFLGTANGLALFSLETEEGVATYGSPLERTAVA